MFLCFAITYPTPNSEKKSEINFTTIGYLEPKLASQFPIDADDFMRLDQSIFLKRRILLMGI